MINASELRIGNMVEYPFTGIEPIRGGADIDNINDNGGNPIPLTPEWLERCGLTKKSDKSKHSYEVWRNESFEIAKVDDGYALHVQDLDEYATWTIYKAIQHLHQLQNLYFALTGEELQIKMP